MKFLSLVVRKRSAFSKPNSSSTWTTQSVCGVIHCLKWKNKFSTWTKHLSNILLPFTDFECSNIDFLEPHCNIGSNELCFDKPFLIPDTNFPDFLHIEDFNYDLHFPSLLLPWVSSLKQMPGVEGQHCQFADACAEYFRQIYSHLENPACTRCQKDQEPALFFFYRWRKLRKNIKIPNNRHLHNYSSSNTIPCFSLTNGLWNYLHIVGSLSYKALIYPKHPWHQPSQPPMSQE